MTEPEYRQDDRTEGYCPTCGTRLSAMTVAARGYCENHGWQHADWEPRRRPLYYLAGLAGMPYKHAARQAVAAERQRMIMDLESRNLTPGVMTGEENDR